MGSRAEDTLVVLSTAPLLSLKQEPHPQRPSVDHHAVLARSPKGSLADPPGSAEDLTLHTGSPAVLILRLLNPGSLCQRSVTGSMDLS